MKFNLVVEVDDQYINEFLAENPTVTLTDLAGQLNNACYLGLDCTNAIIMRQFDMGICETYVKKTVVCDKSWGEFWGDNFPTETECPIDVIEHHAEGHAFPVTDDIIVFARAMWNEGNLTEKLS